MRWRILLVTVALIAAVNTIVAAAAPILTTCSKSINTTPFDVNNIVLGGLVTPNGGGDPVPGGGIPK